MHDLSMLLWERYLMTIEAASSYFRIGENKLRQIANEYKRECVVMNGNRMLIRKRILKKLQINWNKFNAKESCACYDLIKSYIQDSFTLCKISALKRRDNKNRILQRGESQRQDGRYTYKYVDALGKTKYVYAWKLLPTDRTPKGKRDNLSLRERSVSYKEICITISTRRAVK